MEEKKPIKVETYDELGKFIRMFREHYTDLLIVRGPPGTGKSYTTKKVFEDKSRLYINSHLTPMEAYKLLYDNQDYPIIIDDIDNLTGNSQLVSMFKQCGETETEKELQWNSTTHELDGYESSFTTKSNLMIIANKINTKDVNNMALLDRGFHISFKPIDEEIIDKMGVITDKTDDVEDKEEVFDFVKDKLSVSEFGNLRSLVKAFQLKKFTEDWRNIISREMNVSKDLIEARELLEECDTISDAANEFSKSNRTFYRKKKKLES